MADQVPELKLIRMPVITSIKDDASIEEWLVNPATVFVVRADRRAGTDGAVLVSQGGLEVIVGLSVDETCKRLGFEVKA